MICDVCGRHNADNLTFCQDCGRRLRQHRGVAPTPPNGMPKVDLAARLAQGTTNGEPPRSPSAPGEPSPDSNRGSSPSGPASAGRRARPAAPVFSFAPPGAPEAALAPPRPTPTPAAAICSECHSPNPPEHRFCVTCGASLTTPKPRETPKLPPQAIAEAAARPEHVAAVPVYESDQIVGAPVLDIAASGAVPAKIVTCVRCHGQCLSGTRFCKYCGAPLDETPRPTAAPAWPSASSPVDAQRAQEGVGKVPLPPIHRAGHEVGRVPVASVPPFSSGVRPALNPPTPIPAPVAQVLAPIAAEAPRPQPVALATAPQPFAVPPPFPREPRPVADARPVPVADGRAPVALAAQPVALAAQPVALAAQPVADDAPRPVADGTFGRQRLIRNAPPTPLPPRIENAREREAARPQMPGVRSEISALAGSPVPAEPLIPSPPPPRDPARSAAVHVPAAAPAPPAGLAAVQEARAPYALAHPPRSAEPSAGAHAAAPPRAVPGRPRGNGRLVVIVEDGTEGRSFSLAEGHLDIGRTDGDIVLEDDPYVSPRHARLRRGEGQAAALWSLRDLDSTNHVYVRLRKPHALRDGDLLLLGLEVLQFQTVSDGERGLGHAIQHGTYLFGSPATPRRARLCQRTVEGVIRDVYHLFRDETVIGREAGDVVFTADPFLSRRHASIRRNPVTSEFALVDLDSSNGTYVAIRGEVAITDGDFLRIGQHLFRVDLG